MKNEQIIQKTADYVKKSQEGESTGHDWWHTYRVWKISCHIAKSEKADLFIVELAVLLHDIADFKFHDGDDRAGAKVARQWLEKFRLEKEKINIICKIVENVSFKGANVKSSIDTIEGKIVQDADRLDALGAIGIARTFAFGGHKGREIYNPEIKYKLHDSFTEYKNNKNTSINHFYEKLLLLKDRMNTKTGKAMAELRHRYMENFLEEFYKEWQGEI
ncbi:MAG: HD domain-containing protein [bacterium]|nr:HD domain-containing protein [bacterium]